MAPVEQEVTAFDLPVTGEIPAELEGRWLRNGPNPTGGPDAPAAHWFVGSGMVHGVRLRGGKAEWYRNRFVMPGGDGGPNTNVGGFAGTTWAMVEAGQPPVEMSYELDSLGVNRFNDTLPGPFTAHPKYDPSTGELHAIAYHWPDLMDHVQYVVVGSERPRHQGRRRPRPRHADDPRHVAHRHLRGRLRPAGHRRLRRSDGRQHASRSPGSTIARRVSVSCPATAPPTRSSGATSTRASCSTR